ncbi:nuclear transport factor 2 family protein [Xanthomonas vesicatoria]|uniref:Ketosteroid isomerase n=4 Tax=Xanthomonas vesicatoria TaxID=56460 RepID=A0AAJ0IWZ1_9XANT|nr:nuclear transport factor 2 family protein [Xanthomonas vesicatoria]APO95095.1 ketosteroid isomerase [Xanthomonas vesicatoria]APP75266.1 ketosteroid isomerase [Xanthomonas vesicatoria ATCC 35937]EGD10187.1 ketosteroid isomerase-like protein [Xanthomonas vesicatoria ATCC 35937]KHM93241.1 ketosteroid isomerase [Xanthomonas vesicatoria]KTF33583.1 ketosteroid isomerase [Xanthomonas vesicatoria]
MTRPSAIAAALCLAAGAFAGAGAIVPRSAAAADGCAGTSQQVCNTQCVDAAFARWQAGGTGFFEDLLSPDVVWTIHGSGPSAGTLHGRDTLIDKAVRPLTERLASPLRPLRRQLWADGEHVIVQWQGAANLPNGDIYRNQYVWILRMRDGKAVQVDAYLDLAAYDAVLQRAPAQLRRRTST